MQRKPKILVVGSANMDLIVQTSHFPKPGETIIGGSFSMVPGGKGANQAVAAARLGGAVALVARVGNDPFGHANLQDYQKEGINTANIEQDPKVPTGVAMISVDKSGENTIIVASGANAGMGVDNLERASLLFEWADIVLLQLEIPLPVVMAAAIKAKEQGKLVILNPAPACELPLALLENADIITPNEIEAEFLTGIAVTDFDSGKKAGLKLMEKGIQQVVITLGEHGAFMCNRELQEIIPTAVVKAVDTTAAGDTFNGALAVALGNGEVIHNAVRFALKAATRSVQRLGAQSSIPFLRELEGM